LKEADQKKCWGNDIEDVLFGANRKCAFAYFNKHPRFGNNSIHVDLDVGCKRNEL